MIAQMKIGLLLFFLLFIGCQTVKNSDLSSDNSTQLKEQIYSKHYSFVPTMAMPTGGRSVALTTAEYSLTITGDTVKAELPYYGRAYTAPYPGEDGGVSFVSTNFDYELTEVGSNKKINIKIKDNRHRYNLFLEIWNTGKASLRIQDNERQAISYTGNIE